MPLMDRIISKYISLTSKQEGKDLKKVNLVLLVIIHDRWSSRPTNPMHNDLLIGPTYRFDLPIRYWRSMVFLVHYRREKAPLSIVLSTPLAVYQFHFRMKGLPPDRWKALARFSISGSRSCFYRHLAPMEQGSQHCRMTASDWICQIMPTSSVGPVG